MKVTQAVQDLARAIEEKDIFVFRKRTLESLRGTEAHSRALHMIYFTYPVFAGMEREERIALLSEIVGRELNSFNDLYFSEYRALVELVATEDMEEAFNDN